MWFLQARCGLIFTIINPNHNKKGWDSPIIFCKIVSAFWYFTQRCNNFIAIDYVNFLKPSCCMQWRFARPGFSYLPQIAKCRNKCNRSGAIVSSVLQINERGKPVLGVSPNNAMWLGQPGSFLFSSPRKTVTQFNWWKVWLHRDRHR